MPLGTDQMNITTGNVFRPIVWSNKVRIAVEANLVMADLVDRYDDDASEFGKRIQIPDVSNLTAYTKVANTQVTLNSPTEGEVVIDIDQHKECSFLIEDILKVQAKPNYLNKYTGKAGYAIAKVVDSALVGFYAGLSQTKGGTGAITKAVLLNSIRLLDSAEAPESERYLVLHPYAKTQLLNIAGLNEYQSLGESRIQQPVRDNRILPLFGVQIYMTNQIVSTTGTPNTDHNLLFHREAFGLAMQLQPRTQSQYVLEYLGNLVVVDVIYGYAEIRDSFAVDLQSGEADVS